MSDHLPLWVELRIDFSDQFLKNRADEVVEEKKAAAEESGAAEAE